MVDWIVKLSTYLITLMYLMTSEINIKSILAVIPGGQKFHTKMEELMYQNILGLLQSYFLIGRYYLKYC